MPNHLVLTLRNIAQLVAFSHLYELEDVVAEVLDAEIRPLAHPDELHRYRQLYKALKSASRSRAIASSVTQKLIPASLTQPLTQSYDFLLLCLNNPYDLFLLLGLGDWRQHCRKAACYIIEFWNHDFPECDYLVDFLASFDHIFLGTRPCVERVAKLTGRPCSYLPLSVNTLRFSPHNLSEAPTIECCNLGRRSSITHQALLDYAAQQQRFYYYDTMSVSNVVNASKQQTFFVRNPQEHRLLLANLLKRSRYFIANRARINDPQFSQETSELSSRFFEGAAAGTIMLGEAPNTLDFKHNFDWTDAVIPLPFDAPDIAERLHALNAQPERLDSIRRRNVRNALLRHDSVYRLATMFEALDLPASPQIQQRQETLHRLAQTLQEPSPQST